MTTLTDLTVANLPLPPKGQKKYFCDSVDGFGVRVSQGGARTFFLQHGFDRRLISIGRYPRIKLSQARTEAKRLLAEFTLGRIRPQSVTWEQAVKLFIEDKGRSKRAGTVKEYERLLNKHFPYQGQLNGLTVSWLMHRLDRLRELPSEYNHALTAAKVFFNWCAKRRYMTDNPLFAISPHKRPSRTRVLSDTELQSIWRACEQNNASGGHTPSLGTGQGWLSEADHQQTAPVALPAHFATIVKLLILTGQRRGEIAALKAEYFSCSSSLQSTPSISPIVLHERLSKPIVQLLDLCTLPPTLTKNGREHTFPLPELASKLIQSLPSTDTGLLFPARGTDGSKPFKGWGKAKANLDKLSGVTGWTLHDLRRTYRTNLAKLGVAPHIGERLLNHVSSRSPLEDTYDLHRYLPEMRQAVEKWEAYLQTILSPPVFHLEAAE